MVDELAGDSHWSAVRGGAARSTHLAEMLLKFSSASWMRPRYFRHRPFSSLTKQSSSVEYSFSENRDVGEEGRLAHFCNSYSGSPSGTQDTGESDIIHLRGLTSEKKRQILR